MFGHKMENVSGILHVYVRWKNTCTTHIQYKGINILHVETQFDECDFILILFAQVDNSSFRCTLYRLIHRKFLSVMSDNLCRTLAKQEIVRTAWFLYK